MTVPGRQAAAAPQAQVVSDNPLQIPVRAKYVYSKFDGQFIKKYLQRTNAARETSVYVPQWWRKHENGEFRTSVVFIGAS